MIERILARRAALQAQIDQDELEYGRLEGQIAQLQQELAVRDRQLCMKTGGLKELDALLSEDDARVVTNGAHLAASELPPAPE